VKTAFQESVKSRRSFMMWQPRYSQPANWEEPSFVSSLVIGSNKDFLIHPWGKLCKAQLQSDQFFHYPGHTQITYYLMYSLESKFVLFSEERFLSLTSSYSESSQNVWLIMAFCSSFKMNVLSTSITEDGWIHTSKFPSSSHLCC